MYSRQSREDQKVREVIPHTGPIPIIIPLTLFLEDIDFPRIMLPRALRGSWRMLNKNRKVFFLILENSYVGRVLEHGKERKKPGFFKPMVRLLV